MSNEIQNRGVLIADKPRESDYVLGVNSKIEATRLVPNWASFVSPFDTQRNQVTDFLDCVTFSAGHSIEMQLNYLLTTKQLADEAINWFKDNGYIENGWFKISKRYNAKLNGTDKTKGQYLNVAGDSFRKVGFIPDSDWPMTDTMTWDEYYKDVPINLIEKGKKALWFISIQYQWVNQIDVPHLLGAAPIQVATEVCAGWDSGSVVAKCSGQPLQHATLVYNIDERGSYCDLDQYPPFVQKLAADYELPQNVQYMLTSRPVSLRKGMQGVNVLNLQEALNKLGYGLMEDGQYGPKTETAVMNFQNKSGISSDGIAGPKTLAKLAEFSSTKIDKWCDGIKQREGARLDRNNPGNLRFIGQQYSIDDKGFCKFDTYQHGYDALKNMIINACSGKSKVYNPNGTLYDFFNTYAPASDNNDPKSYAEFVAGIIGVEPTIIIKNLL